MFAQAHGGDAGRTMDMVRRADHHRVDVLDGFQHLAVIAKARRVRMGVIGFGGTRVVDVAESDDVFPELAERLDVVTAATAGSNKCDVQFLIGRWIRAACGTGA